MTIQVVTAAGDKKTTTATYKRNGKPYAETGNPDWDAIAVTRVSPLEVKVDLVRAGQIIGHVMVVVSMNLRIKTYHTTYTSVAGQVVHMVGVYDRQ